MKISLINDFGNIKQVKVGFSWTVFFFGTFVPLFRLDIKWFLGMFFASIASGLIIPFLGPFIIGWIFCFKYNSFYIKDLIKSGYAPITDIDRAMMSAI